MRPVRLGVEGLLESGPAGLSGHGSAPRIGMLTHDGAMARWDGADATSRSLLLKAGFDLVRLFSPEHGITAAALDGQSVMDGADPDTGLPVVSLYGPNLAPSPEHLADLDIVFVDLQDIGARFYTYVWTVSHLLEAGDRAGVPILILDRPNPLGGRLKDVEGPILDPGAASFLGRWPVPVRHSLTLGELASLLRAEMGLGTSLQVLPMGGWDRSMMWEDTGIPFVPPSPGIPTREAILTYPALALLEATNLHVGRSTSRAFRWFGAPWLDSSGLTGALTGLHVPGLEAREETLLEGHPNGPIPGIRLEVTDPSRFRPVESGLRLLALLATFDPDHFRWAHYPTAVNPRGEDHLERLLGRPDIAEVLRARPGTVSEPTVDEWCRSPGWLDRVGDHLLYH